jgi:hypothetical protein
MALAAHISLYSAFLSSFSPEIERIMYSLQFMFADSITPLLVDYRTKRLVLCVQLGTASKGRIVTIRCLFQYDMHHRIHAAR